MGGLDSSVLERIAKIMSYMTVAGECLLPAACGRHSNDRPTASPCASAAVAAAFAPCFVMHAPC